MRIYLCVKYLLAVWITVFLSPGIGHFVIGKIKKGFLLLALTACIVIFTSIILLTGEDLSAIPRDYALMKIYAANLLSKDSFEITLLYAFRAAVMAYALVDLVYSFIGEQKKLKGIDDENK
jgi:uncharacterized metal-binding protein